jgi:hypothetical protein
MAPRATSCDVTYKYTDVYLILDKLDCNGCLPKSSIKELQNPQFISYMYIYYQRHKFKPGKERKGIKNNRFFYYYISRPSHTSIS